jgi:hypothetical protein
MKRQAAMGQPDTAPLEQTDFPVVEFTDPQIENRGELQ